MARSDDVLTEDGVAVGWPLVPFALLLVVAALSPPRSPFGLSAALAATVLFPGYLLSLLVFPLADHRSSHEGETDGTGNVATGWASGLDRWERWAAAAGFGVCLMPVYAAVITLVSLSYDKLSVAAVVGGTTVMLVAAAFVRRRRLPVDLQTRAPGLPVTEASVESVDISWSGERVSDALIVLMLMTAAVALVAGITIPSEQSGYTTVALLSPDGESVAAEYPQNLPSDEAGQFTFVLTNHESETVQYTVTIQAQRISPDGDVVARQRVGQFETTVAHNETQQQAVRIQQNLRGDRVRLAFLVYRSALPTVPSTENAYRSLTLWVRDSSSAIEATRARPDLDPRSRGDTLETADHYRSSDDLAGVRPE